MNFTVTQNFNDATHWIPIGIDMDHNGLLTPNKLYKIYYSPIEDEQYMVDDSGNNSTWWMTTDGISVIQEYNDFPSHEVYSEDYINNFNNIKLKEVKCIKEKCRMYFDSDIYESCKLKPGSFIAKGCIGFNEIEPKMEEIMCRVATLMTEHNTLAQLKNWILDNQD